MSKAQRWAYAVKHKSTILNPDYLPSHLKLSNNVYSCNPFIDPLGSDDVCKRVVCSSSQASDVPGPDTTLYLDPTVPFLPLRTNPRQTNAGSLNIPVNTVDLSNDQQECPNGGNPIPNPISSSGPIQLISTPILLSIGAEVDFTNNASGIISIGQPFSVPPSANGGISVSIQNPPLNNVYNIQIEPIESGLLNNDTTFATDYITSIKYVVICNRKNENGEYTNFAQTQPYQYNPPLTESVTAELGPLEIKPDDKITTLVTVSFDVSNASAAGLPQHRAAAAKIIITVPTNTENSATIRSILIYKIV